MSEMHLDSKTTRALRWIIEILKREEIKFRITGGLAAKLYGSQRTLNDIDIDIRDEDLVKVFSDVSAYCTMPLMQYQDAKWNLEMMTLEYQGQEIDIAGGSKQKIFDSESHIWKVFPADFENVRIVQMEDMKLPVISPEDLAAYKVLLDGEHQKEDIIAITRSFELGVGS